jgi:hypothetical protein
MLYRVRQVHLTGSKWVQIYKPSGFLVWSCITVVASPSVFLLPCNPELSGQPTSVIWHHRNWVTSSTTKILRVKWNIYVFTCDVSDLFRANPQESSVRITEVERRTGSAVLDGNVQLVLLQRIPLLRVVTSLYNSKIMSTCCGLSRGMPPTDSQPVEFLRRK